MKLFVACGGTGGHVFPGLAAANYMAQNGHDVTVLYSGRAIESSTYHAWKGNVFRTCARPLTVKNLLWLPLSTARCLYKLIKDRPDVLLAMGSYSSLPPVLAARLLFVPVVLHEANAVPGKAIEFLSRLADVTAVSFKETAKFFPGRKVVFTGLPVRADMEKAVPRDDFPKDGPFTIFITGGSQGAHRVNELVSDALCALEDKSAFRVLHQSGTADETVLKNKYAAAGVQAVVEPFVKEMGRAYASADLVICRAGASTCFELCVLGKPAFLIPLPTAVRDHQTKNAEMLVNCGGAVMGEQKELTPEIIGKKITALMQNPAELARMKSVLLKAAGPHAEMLLAAAISEVASR